MNVYVSIMIEQVEEDADVQVLAQRVVDKVKAELIYNDVTLNEVEVV